MAPTSERLSDTKTPEVLMATIEIKRAGVIHACVWLAVLWAGCDNLDDATKQQLALGRTGSGGSASSSDEAPSAGTPSNATATASSVDPGKPAGSGAGGGAGAGCKMREDEKQVCVTCYDAKGNVVRDGCYTKDPKPAGDECYDIKRVDGALCTICFDAKSGTVSKSSCRVPDANGCAMPGTPPAPPIMCKEYDDKGQRCVVCYDQGKEVKRDCAGAPPSGGGVACEETKHADGTVCTVCTDDKGNVLKKGCTAPLPLPDPAGITCKETVEKGLHCTVCVDAKGTEVKRGCWETAPGMPQDPKDPACKEYRSDAGDMCIICVDAKGTVIKQSCPATAPAPGMPPAPPAK
jgi:hypothetical protein